MLLDFGNFRPIESSQRIGRQAISGRVNGCGIRHRFGSQSQERTATDFERADVSGWPYVRGTLY